MVPPNSPFFDLLPTAAALDALAYLPGMPSKMMFNHGESRVLKSQYPSLFLARHLFLFQQCDRWSKVGAQVINLTLGYTEPLLVLVTRTVARRTRLRKMTCCLAFSMGVDSQIHRSRPWLLLCCLCAVLDGGEMDGEMVRKLCRIV